MDCFTPDELRDEEIKLILSILEVGNTVDGAIIAAMLINKEQKRMEKTIPLSYEEVMEGNTDTPKPKHTFEGFFDWSIF